MHKLWKIKDSNSNKLILIKDKVIYKGNPSENDLNRVNSETTNLNFLNSLFSIPYSYIKKIENQQETNYIKILYGVSSEEELNIENKSIKKEIFEFLKNDIEKFKYSVEKPSIISYAKAQFFALFFITVILIWSLYLANEIESGAKYEFYISGTTRIVGLIYLIANLGKLKIIIGYLILLSITIFALRNRLINRSEIEILKR